MLELHEELIHLRLNNIQKHFRSLFLFFKTIHSKILLWYLTLFHIGAPAYIQWCGIEEFPLSLSDTHIPGAVSRGATYLSPLPVAHRQASESYRQRKGRSSAKPPMDGLSYIPLYMLITALDMHYTHYFKFIHPSMFESYHLHPYLRSTIKEHLWVVLLLMSENSLAVFMRCFSVSKWTKTDLTSHIKYIFQ